MLLSELTPGLREIREKEQAEDRRLARRFNVFKYLRDDELGLSRVIADLLDPRAEHGHGATFLEAMLGLLPETGVRFGAAQPTPAGPIRVETERLIPEKRRIDITVDIPLDQGRFCLAFENKPYAHDLSGQVSGYLEYLNEVYGGRFLLVYVPPTHCMPDEISLPPESLGRWRDHFTVMPYAESHPSLETWLATCRERCAADGLRWFLRHAEQFCKHRFGGFTMTDSAETRFVHDHLRANPKHMHAALAVHDAWPALRDEVCRRFLNHLRDTLERRLREEMPELGPDLHVRCHYGGEKRFANALWISRDRWVPYDVAPGWPGHDPAWDRRTAIRLHSHGNGPSDWLWGVHVQMLPHQMTDRERERRERLLVALRSHGLSLASASDHWHQHGSPHRYHDWYPLAPELHEECEAGDGPITAHYAGNLLHIARHAIPAIDEVEGPAANPEG